MPKNRRGDRGYKGGKGGGSRAQWGNPFIN